MRRAATYIGFVLGAAMVAVGVVSIFLDLSGTGVEARPEVATGGGALMLASGLIGNGNGTGKNGNGRADTRRGAKR